MTGSKHRPIPIERYFDIHDAAMDDFRSSGVIVADALPVDFDELPVVKMKGIIYLRDGLKLKVKKVLKVSYDLNGDALIHTESYSYNLSQSGTGNIFRYDNAHAHPGHESQHHYHEFDRPGGREIGPPREIPEDSHPTLGEVILQADNYYWTHIHPKEVLEMDAKLDSTEHLPEATTQDTI